MKKKTIAIISLILVIILIVIGIIYASVLAQEHYNHKKEEPLLESINLEEITGENGLVFKIERSDVYSDCNSVFLAVYDDGTYQLTTTERIQSGEIVHPVLIYEEPITGTYTYNIEEIFLNLKQTSKKYYVITTGTNEIYTTDKANEKLNEFLKEIDVDLDACLQKIVKE